METIMIDEKGLNTHLVNEARILNTKHIALLSNELVKRGIDTSSDIGGLHEAMCFEGLSLETNINNLLSVFCINVSESVGFQVDNITLHRNQSLMLDYLKDRKLEQDFIAYKKTRATNSRQRQITNNL